MCAGGAKIPVYKPARASSLQPKHLQPCNPITLVLHHYALHGPLSVAFRNKQVTPVR
jgi:hypothetical protein